MQSPHTGQSSYILLFSCHSIEEIDNLLPVAKAIEKQARGVECHFHSQDALYHQNVAETLEERGATIVDDGYDSPLREPFQFAGLRDKMRALVETPAALVPLADEYDGFVFGFDGLPVRAFTHEAKKSGKPTFQIIQGFQPNTSESEYSVINRVSRRAEFLIRTKLAARLPRLGYLSHPSYIGGSHDGPIFVAGNRTRLTLKNRGVDPTRIHVTGVPRFIPLIKQSEGSSFFVDESQIDLLYIPSAFESHDSPNLATAQRTQIEALIDTISEYDATLSIKPHPRQREGMYESIKRYGEVNILNQDADLHETVLNSDLVLTIGSTVAYEAAILGRPVALTRFPHKQCARLSKIPMTSDFPVAGDVADIWDLVATLREDPDKGRSLVVEQRKAAYDVFDKQTPSAVEKIASEIVSRLR